jgi:predicted PurR-regulated permease PerM
MKFTIAVLIVIFALTGLFALDTFNSSNRETTRLAMQLNTSSGQTEMAWQELKAAEPELAQRYRDARTSQFQTETEWEKSSRLMKTTGLVSFCSIILAFVLIMGTALVLAARKHSRIQQRDTTEKPNESAVPAQ